MSKKIFSEINVRAAGITGAVFGFLCGLFAPFWWGSFGYGMTGYMMGGIFPIYELFSIVFGTIFGIIFGMAIAIIYNLALKSG